ncbi:MAG: hypothetical protein U0R71_16060 [Solirubrobacterales bacterium]
MSNGKPVLVLAAALVLAVSAASLAAATVSGPRPRAGAYEFQDTVGGFSLVKGRGKHAGTLYLTNVHTVTSNFVGCPPAPLPIKVEGRYPLKLLALAGYPGYRAWGVGKTGNETRYADGSPGIVSIPAKVKVAGKVVEGGAVKMDFSTTEPDTLSLLVIEFGPKGAAPCPTYSEVAKHA